MKRYLVVLGVTFGYAASTAASLFFFNTGDVDGKMASASRPALGGKIEIESADDFIASREVRISSATFTGLITGGGTIGDVDVEIYRVFPKDSANPPSGNVTTRANSPSDVAFDTRDAAGGGLTFTANTINTAFTAANSVLNGINKAPNQQTGGEGQVTGAEVTFTVNFATPFDLPADHYFFIPQVQITGGEFYWLSSPRPIVPPGTAFAPDLQSWIRNENLAPDWSRIGTDIVGGTTPPTFNAAFTLTGETVPEPATLALLGIGFAGLGFSRRKQ